MGNTCSCAGQQDYACICERKPYDILGQHALTSKVLVVAVRGDVEDWAAYIDAVPGQNHSEERWAVVKTGGKLHADLAAFLFPYLNPKQYRR